MEREVSSAKAVARSPARTLLIYKEISILILPKWLEKNQKV
jgi:hypothetical protein